MSQLFNEEFYELDDADDAKPTFDTDSEYDYENGKTDDGANVFSNLLYAVL